MKFSDIVDNEEIRAGLRWDNPERYYEPVCIRSDDDMKKYENRLREQAGYYIVIDVWNMQPRLGLMHILENGDSRVEKIEFEPDISNSIEKLMEDAVEQAGGSLSRSGQYPLSPMLREYLRNTLIVERHRSRNRTRMRRKRANAGH